MTKQTITTSIAYINAEPHIGFLLELVAADVLARFQRQIGNEVFFLTGTDEHGIKIQQAIEKTGKKPQEYADEITSMFEQTAKDFNISNDYFVRTTDPKHIEFVQDIWRRLSEKGVVTKKAYEGYYCTGCEAFKTEREIVDGKCTIHEKPVEKVSEENWFLVISDELKLQINGWLENVEPVGRANEAKSALKDFNEVSISRPKSKLYWGVPVPGDEDQTMYVWVDALFNYLSGIELSGRKIEDFWPADVQVIGKDILKFHAIIWPAMLLSLGYELPKKMLVHGFVNVEGKKMSKSLGNVITPAQLKDRYGVDGTRYLLLRQLSFYDDSNFSWAEFDAIYNGELANGIGNLAARVGGLLKRLDKRVETEIQVEGNRLELFDFAGALTVINSEIKALDKSITEQKIWEGLAESKEKQEELVAIAEKILAIADLLEPFTPDTAKEIRRQFAELDPKPIFPRTS